LAELLERLGYCVGQKNQEGVIGEWTAQPPVGRKAVFLGDLTGRGPRIADVLELVMNMVASRAALCVPGNHDIKLLRKLQGRPVEIKRGLMESLEQVNCRPEAFRRRIVDFFDNILDHCLLDDRKLVVAHAGMPEAMQGESSMPVREFALFGVLTEEVDEHGYPIRFNWASEYHGAAMVVYGHTPMREPKWVNNTINIDTGCIFGGKLTALRYPEKELVSVSARRVYWPGKSMKKH
jgi:protein phosphatase